MIVTVVLKLKEVSDQRALVILVPKWEEKELTDIHMWVSPEAALYFETDKKYTLEIREV